MSIRIQIINDSEGRTTGVFIPIDEWQRVKACLDEAEIVEADDLASGVALFELQEAAIELARIQEGSLRGRPANDLLDEL
jgi:hypothetical protein